MDRLSGPRWLVYISSASWFSTPGCLLGICIMHVPYSIRVEVEFYKRRLSEADFKKRNLEYQEKLDEVESKLGMKTRERH